jgi:hypothetical protein
MGDRLHKLRNPDGLRGMRRRVMNEQLALSDLGPNASDAFRFNWWTIREGAPVWIEHRGRWRAGVVVGLGRKRALIAIKAAQPGRLFVATPYEQLRRRR